MNISIVEQNIAFVDKDKDKVNVDHPKAVFHHNNANVCNELNIVGRNIANVPKIRVAIEAPNLTRYRAMIQHHPDFYSIDTPMHKGGIEMGARVAICRLQDGNLWVHAPLEISNADHARIQNLGEVTQIVVPNTFHYTQVEEFATRFPHATVYAPDALEGKLESVPHLELDGNIGVFASDFDALLFDTAPLLHEWVFCHRGSQTLLLTDLCFNIAAPDNLVGKVGASVLDLGNGLAPSRALRVDLAIGDKKRTRELLDEVLSWDFDRVSVAHGAIVESGGKEAFRAAFEWLEGEKGVAGG